MEDVSVGRLRIVMLDMEYFVMKREMMKKGTASVQEEWDLKDKTLERMDN